MSKETPDTATLSTEQAMAMALSAERESLQSIAECEADAERILEQARHEAHQISLRTDSRIALVHQRCKQLAADEINRGQQSAEDRMNNIHKPLDKEAIEHALMHLAESLTVAGKQSSNSDS